MPFAHTHCCKLYKQRKKWSLISFHDCIYIISTLHIGFYYCSVNEILEPWTMHRIEGISNFYAVKHYNTLFALVGCTHEHSLTTHSYGYLFSLSTCRLEHRPYSATLGWLTDSIYLNPSLRSMWDGQGLGLWVLTRLKDGETRRGILAERHAASSKCSPRFSSERIVPGSFNERWIRWTRGSGRLCRRRKLLIS